MNQIKGEDMKLNTKNLTVLGLMSGVTVLLASTPLGFIPVGPIAATTMHIPVLIVAVLYGRKMGALMGAIFGLLSLFRAYTQPSLTSFILMNPMVSVLPRVVFGFVAGSLSGYLEKKDPAQLKKVFIAIFSGLAIYLAYSSFKSYQVGEFALSQGILLLITVGFGLYFLRKDQGDGYSDFISATLATGIHTAMVMGSIYIWYAREYAQALGIAEDKILALILSVIVVNGIPEMILAGYIVPAITKIGKKLK